MQVKHIPAWLSVLELVVVGGIAPWFLVPSLGFRVWFMVIPLIFWALRLLLYRQLTAYTPLSIPILIIGIMLGISMLVTFDPYLSLPKVVGIFYGITVYFVIINNISWGFTKRIVLPALLLAGFALAGLSLFGMRWTGAKLPLIGPKLQQLGDLMPRLLNGIPRAEKGISTNQLGGTLILLIPLQATLFINSLKTLHGKAGDWVRMIGCGSGVLLSLFVLLLTQSRGAVAAVIVVLSALLLFYFRHSRWLIITLMTLSLVLGGVVIFGISRDDASVEVELVEISDSFALKTRPEIWSRAYRMLQDHPYTGIGFDTFSKVLSARYPTFQIPMERSIVIPHAHNLYLQTALDLGVPGLIAFLALHMIVGWMLIRTVQQSDSLLIKATASGLFLGLVAQLLYGWIDCIALGQKPSIFFWVYLALSTVVYQTEIENLSTEDVFPE